MTKKKSLYQPNADSILGNKDFCFEENFFEGKRSVLKERQFF